jgi:hypothetical protein
MESGLDDVVEAEDEDDGLHSFSRVEVELTMVGVVVWAMVRDASVIRLIKKTVKEDRDGTGMDGIILRIRLMLDQLNSDYCRLSLELRSYRGILLFRVT